MPLPAGSVDKLFLHNSFEHFEGDIDTGFVREAWRVLRPGGGLCVVPLYLSARHQIVTDPLVDRSGIEWDPDAEVVERIGHRNRFGRFYSAETLAERVLRPAFECGFRAEICAFHGPPMERTIRSVALSWASTSRWYCASLDGRRSTRELLARPVEGALYVLPRRRDSRSSVGTCPPRSTLAAALREPGARADCAPHRHDVV